LTPLLNLGDFIWNFGINYSYGVNKVISITEDLTELPVTDNVNASVSYAVVGEQFPVLRVTDVVRDPEGHIVVDAQTGLPKKAGPLVIAGHANPNHILGLNTDLNYKGFKLAIVAEYRTGNMIYNAIGSALDFTGVSEHSAQNGRQPFVMPNTVIETSPGVYVPNTDVVIRDAGYGLWVSSDYYNSQSTYVTSAAFWKLREVSLGYTVPVQKLWGGKVIKDATVSLIGRNLLMLRPKSNVWTDPEFNTSSATSHAVGRTDENQTPPTRIFGFSIKLTF
jgi:hypothetical protein